jgi:hypothetical protein
MLAIPTDALQAEIRWMAIYPRVVTPNHYNLEITTDIYQAQPPFPFSGIVEIYVTGIVETNFVVLNSLNLEIVKHQNLQPTPTMMFTSSFADAATGHCSRNIYTTKQIYIFNCAYLLKKSNVFFKQIKRESRYDCFNFSL